MPSSDNLYTLYYNGNEIEELEGLTWDSDDEDLKNTEKRADLVNGIRVKRAVEIAEAQKSTRNRWWNRLRLSCFSCCLLTLTAPFRCIIRKISETDKSNPDMTKFSISTPDDDDADRLVDVLLAVNAKERDRCAELEKNLTQLGNANVCLVTRLLDIHRLVSSLEHDSLDQVAGIKTILKNYFDNKGPETHALCVTSEKLDLENPDELDDETAEREQLRPLAAGD